MKQEIVEQIVDLIMITAVAISPAVDSVPYAIAVSTLLITYTLRHNCHLVIHVTRDKEE